MTLILGKQVERTRPLNAQNQNLFTTEGTEDTEEEKGLPRKGADERGLRTGIRPVEWKPTPDMYRMDTQEGREAYEASFRSGERKPAQAVMAQEECAETYAVLG